MLQPKTYYFMSIYNRYEAWHDTVIMGYAQSWRNSPKIPIPMANNFVMYLILIRAHFSNTMTFLERRDTYRRKSINTTRRKNVY